MTRCCRALLLTGLALGVAWPAVASAEASRERDWQVSVYGAQWADSRILDIPVQTVTGRLRFERSYYVGLGVTRTLIRSYDLPLPLIGTLRGNSLELDTSLLRHLGRQDHWEVAAALVGRTGQIRPGAGIGINLAFGAGLSYALGRPRFELGRNGVRGQDNYPLQFHLLAEVEFTHDSLGPWSVLSRIHHRSGAYGVLAPQSAGSNYIAVGLRRSF